MNLQFSLNHMAAASMPLTDFVALASELKISQIEIRNDIAGQAIADGISAEQVRAVTGSKRILAINALQQFNNWNQQREQEAEQLIRFAADCGARALVLCPVNIAGWEPEQTERDIKLRQALSELKGMLEYFGITGLVEPLGFPQSSLRLKQHAVEAIKAVDGEQTFRILHDTFHHHLAGEQQYFPELTGLVHISGVNNPELDTGRMQDCHRILISEADCLGNIKQLAALIKGGYQGAFSFEPFAAEVYDHPQLAAELKKSVAFIEDAVSSAITNNATHTTVA
ncbi:TIM barrel protein [Spongorhabdus nitratireducens]